MKFSADMLAELYRKPGITESQYRKAVETLLPFAMGDTSAAEPAAMVLLSAFNGYHWKLSIPDLCCLDWELYDAAMAVIQGRVELRKEPHALIQNGQARFSELCREWEHLNQACIEEAI